MDHAPSGDSTAGNPPAASTIGASAVDGSSHSGEGQGAQFPVAPSRRRPSTGSQQSAQRSQPHVSGASCSETPGEELPPSDHDDAHSGTEPEREPILQIRAREAAALHNAAAREDAAREGTRKTTRNTSSSVSSNGGGNEADASGLLARKASRKPVVIPGALPDSNILVLARWLNSFALWFGQLDHQYGGNLLWLLFSSQHMLKGVVQQFQASAVMWILMEYRVSGPQMQVYTGVANSSWALKPIIGVVSDLFPIFGYRKAPYCVLTALLGVACTTMIGFSTKETTSELFIVGCLFGMSLQAATCDLLTEAKYSEHLHENPKFGPDLITYVWGGISVGNMTAIAVVGWIITNLGPRLVFLACLVPSAVVLYPALANYFEEQPLTSETVRQARDLFMRQSEVVFLCILMTLLTIFLTTVGMVSDSHTVQFAAALSVIVILLPTFHILLRPEIACMNTFFVLQAALSLNIGGATFYFYTDQKDQYPDGPHFSASFFATTLGFVSSAMSLVGLAIYTRFMKDWSYRSLLFISNILVTILSLLDVVFFLRLNARIGIPDDYFVMGSSVCTVVIRQWQWMPGVVVMSQLCPAGMEATMFALLAGSANVGSQAADYLGAYMLATLNVHPSGAKQESHQFDNLWKASCVSTLLPAATIALIPVLIPQAKQTDKLLLSDTSSATARSLYSRWKAWRRNDHES